MGTLALGPQGLSTKTGTNQDSVKESRKVRPVFYGLVLSPRVPSLKNCLMP